MSNEAKQRFARLAAAVAAERDQQAFAELFDYFAPQRINAAIARDPEQPEATDARIETQERDERVRRAMRDLPDDQALLLRQAFFLGRSHSQIAEETGLPLGTVKSRIRLAFARLRRSLDAEDADSTLH